MTAEVCIIYNPRAGKGQAERRLLRLRRALRDRATFLPTREPGHGEELARAAAGRGCQIVVAAGGDGTVHEIANGLLFAPTHQSVLAVLPIGSANDYAYSLGLDVAWWRHADPAIRPHWVDAALISSPGGRQRWFVNCLGVGFNGFVTREARKIKSLQGVPLYGLAILRAMRKWFHAPLIDIGLDGEPAQRVPTLALTLGLGRREGAFPLTPNAVLDDGLVDFLHVGRLSRWGLLRYFPRMVSGRIPTTDTNIGAGRCCSMHLVSQAPLMVHADGEFFCQPEDKVYEMTIEVAPERLRVIRRLV